MKVVMLFGLLTFCGSQGALANTEFASTLQSADLFGEIDDISKSFASVRKPSRISILVLLLVIFIAFSMQLVSRILEPWNKEIFFLAFENAFLLIFSELGNKTFFIAAVFASRNPGAVVFAGTFGALAQVIVVVNSISFSLCFMPFAMTAISVFLGRAFHYIDGILPFWLYKTKIIYY